MFPPRHQAGHAANGWSNTWRARGCNARVALAIMLSALLVAGGIYLLAPQLQSRATPQLQTLYRAAAPAPAMASSSHPHDGSVIAPAAGVAGHVWVLVTAAVSGKFHPASGEFHNATRQQQYEKALPLLRYAVDQANLDSTMIIVENKGPRTTYLDTIAQQIQAKLLYTSNENQVHTTNKGVREYADLHDALEFAAQIEPLSADDWVVKVTGRYMIFSPSPLLAALSNPNLDVIARFGSWAFKGPPRERAMNDLVTGFFAMRVHVWKAFFTANPRGVDPPGAQPDDPIAWATGRFIQSHVPPERVLALDELNALISPGTDDYFVI